jgi:hypothetical protein
MVEPRHTTKAGLTPAKIGLIAVLSIILAAVIVFQMTGKGSRRVTLKKRVPNTDASAARDTGNDAPHAPSGAGAPRTRRAEKWQDIPRSEVLLHDPFALPEQLASHHAAPVEEDAPAEPDAAQQTRGAELMESFRTQGVSMILTTPQGTIATIGSVQLRVGDVLEGLRVTEIGPRGVVFVEEHPNTAETPP